MTDITLPRAELEQVLEALKEINKLSIGENAICLPAEIDTGMDALRERLAQPQRTWVGLTDEEIAKLADDFLAYQIEDYQVSGVFTFARAIEAKLKEKNT